MRIDAPHARRPARRPGGQTDARFHEHHRLGHPVADIGHSRGPVMASRHPSSEASRLPDTHLPDFQASRCQCDMRRAIGRMLGNAARPNRRTQGRSNSPRSMPSGGLGTPNAFSDKIGMTDSIAFHRPRGSTAIAARGETKILILQNRLVVVGLTLVTETLVQNRS